MVLSLSFSRKAARAVARGLRGRGPQTLWELQTTTLMEESYDRRKIGRQASWPADLRGTSAGAGAYRTHVGPYHPPSMKRSSRCMPTTLPLYLEVE